MMNEIPIARVKDQKEERSNQNNFSRISGCCLQFYELTQNIIFIPQVEAVQWTFDEINSESGELHHLAAFLADKKIELVINLPMRGGGARR
jgi:hypothetical protein